MSPLKDRCSPALLSHPQPPWLSTCTLSTPKTGFQQYGYWTYHPWPLNLFSTCHRILLLLFISCVFIGWGLFVTLIGYFPNISDLGSSTTLFGLDNRHAPHVPHAFCGRLSVNPISKDSMYATYDLLAGLQLECEGVEIFEMYDHCFVVTVYQNLEHLTTSQFKGTSTLSTFYIVLHSTGLLISLSRAPVWPITLSGTLLAGVHHCVAMGKHVLSHPLPC